MRIAMVCVHVNPAADVDEADWTSQHLHLTGLADGLSRAGHDVRAYYRRDHASAPASDRASELIGIPAGPARPVSGEDLVAYLGEFAEALVERWRAERPDVVHAHFWTSGLAAALAARRLGVPVVQSFHSLGPFSSAQGTRPRRARFERLIAKQVDRVVAADTRQRSELARRGMAGRGVPVVPSGVDLDRFSPSGGHTARGGRTRVLAAVRSGSGDAGAEDVLGALRLSTSTEVVLVGGDADEQRRLRSLARSNGMAERVDVLGTVSHHDMPELLRSADIAACTPRHESSGLLAIEAMACGVPVVTYGLGGLMDIVVDGVTGLHASPRRPDTLTHALRSLVSNVALREGFGVAARERACSRYGWPRIADDTVRAYRRAGASARSARRGERGWTARDLWAPEAGENRL